MNILNLIPDIIVVLLVLLSIITGYAKGFIRTFLHAIGWILSMVLAFVWSPKIQEWLLSHTKVYENMRELLTEKFADSVPGATATFDILPSSLSKGLSAFTGNVSSLMTTRMTDIIFTIFSFVLVILAVKLVLYILVGVLSKKNRRGLTGMVDGVLGAVAGCVTGILLVYVLLALLIPLAALVGADLTQTINQAIDKSFIVKEMYNNNLIVLVFQNFLTGLR
ncbi:MAG: CvpA family protein [Anaerovoracaceae bacterium]|jgi:uncharacterized membrane protein required for colicin V production|nr:CvpA family protein [Anaerovoracaceae bacterium]